RRATALGRPDDEHSQPEDHRIVAAVKHVDATAGGAQGRAQVVRDTHGRGQEDNAVNAVRRKGLRGSQDDGAAGAVADQVDPAPGASPAILEHLSGEQTPLREVVGVIDMIADIAAGTVPPAEGLDLHLRASLYHAATPPRP